MLVGSGNKLSAVGASTVADIGVWPVTQTDGFMYWVWALSGDSFVPHPTVSQGSETLTQTLARIQDGTNGFPAHVANFGTLPSHAIVLCGRNNMNATNVSDIKPLLQTYEQILDYLLSLGIMPIPTAVLPSDNAASVTIHQRNLPIYNMGIALMARKKGLPFIDANHTIVDTATGAIQSALRIDPLHLNSDGARIFGTYVANRLVDSGFMLPWDIPLAISNDANTDDAYLLPNMLMLNDTGGQPSSWSKGGTDAANLTVTTVSGASDGILGDWMKMTKTATAGDAQEQSTTVSVPAGNWVAMSWVDKFVYTSGTPVVTTYLKSGSTNLVYKQIGADNTAGRALAKNFQIVKIPAGSPSAGVLVVMNAVGEYYIGQVSLMDLTACGLDGWI